MTALRRIEAKVEKHPNTTTSAVETRMDELNAASSTNVLVHLHESSSTTNIRPIPSVFDGDGSSTPDSPSNVNQTPITFSGYCILFWPAVQKLLPVAASQVYSAHGERFPVVVETQRPPLELDDNRQCDQCGHNNWLAQLNINTVKELCDAYFASFNLFTPILDCNFFFQHTLGDAIHGDFGYSIESCLVLTVMALGCSSRESLTKNGFVGWTRRRQNSQTNPLDSQNGTIPGLGFINETRRRIGFLLCDNSIQSCQLYLLMRWVISFNLTITTQTNNIQKFFLRKHISSARLLGHDMPRLLVLHCILGWVNIPCHILNIFSLTKYHTQKTNGQRMGGRYAIPFILDCSNI